MYAQLQEHDTRISEAVQRYLQAYVQHAEATTSATHRHPVVAAAVAQLQQVMQGAGWGANNIAWVMRDVRKQAGNTSSSSTSRLDNCNRSNTAWGTVRRRRRPTAAAAAAAACDGPFGSSSSGPRADYSDEHQHQQQEHQRYEQRQTHKQEARRARRDSSHPYRRAGGCGTADRHSSAGRRPQQQQPQHHHQQQQQQQDARQRESATDTGAGAGAAGPMPRQEFEASHFTVF
jgi:hypothetical protein